VHGDTLIVGPSNLPSSGAVHASELYSRNLYNMLKLLLVEGDLQLDWEDEVVSSCILTHAGGLYHEPSAVLMNLDVVERGTGASITPAQSTVSTQPDQSAGWLEENTDVAERAVQDVPLEPGNASYDESESDEENASSTAMADRDSAASDTTAEASGEEKSAEHSAAPPQTDNLQAITGIGPVLESRLQEFGVLTYADLAALDQTQAERLEMQLEIEDLGTVSTWVEQARRKLS